MKLERRYDIDWVRVIAIGLLLIYHVAIGFQSWGTMIGFITNGSPWTALWTPMTMLNIWRIPLLFFVSGMGVYFAMQQRDWKQLLKERSLRILLPYVFGIIAIVPIHVYIWKQYYYWDFDAGLNPGHLWFLGNIFAYVLLLLPLFYFFRKNENGWLVTVMKKALSTPLGLIPVVLLFIAEALILHPFFYEMYAMTWHGFFLGLLAFFFGFCFVLCGDTFWPMIRQWKWLFLAIGVLLFGLRASDTYSSIYLLVIESNSWILSVFAFAFSYLNKPSKALSYLSQAAYPVYILHMVFLYLGSWLIFPLKMTSPIQFILVLGFTGLGCFLTYELIRRVKYIRPLFGLGSAGHRGKLPH